MSATFRDGVLLDEAAFIDLYRRVYEALLADTPGRSSLLRLVDLAIAQDHQENASLLAAFAMLDPDRLARTRRCWRRHVTRRRLRRMPRPSSCSCWRRHVPAAARYLVLRARARN